MPLLRRESFDDARWLVRAPGFKACLVDAAFGEEFLADCEAALPALGYHRKNRPEYRVWAAHPGEGTPLLRSLRRVLGSRMFLSFLKKTFGGGRVSPPFAFEFLRFGEGDYLAPHSDATEGRRIQGVLYFNRDWRRRQGGLLRLTDGPRKKALAAPVAPLFNRLVLFASDRGFLHAVTPLKSAGPRYSLSFSYRQAPARGLDAVSARASAR